MRTSVAMTASLMVAVWFVATAEFTVLMYRDSSFEDYVGQARFDSADRCYPLCTDSEAVAAFVWDGEPQGTQLVVFDDVECRGRSVVGAQTEGAEFSAVASNRKVQSFILSTTDSHEPTRGVVHSCNEKSSDLVFKAFNDSVALM